MSIFKHLDYKKFLGHQIKAQAAVRGYKGKLAQAAGCSASYLSQVLKGSFELAPEHALGLSLFWGFSAYEKDYFVHLVLLARAGTPALKKYYESLCRKIAEEHARVEARGNTQEVRPDWRDQFYSSWHFTAVHELTTFGAGMEAPEMARRLELPLSLVEETLEALGKMGLAAHREKGWQTTVGDLMVEPGSIHASHHVSGWLQRAALDTQRKRRPLPSFHKSWIFGIHPDDYARLRELIVEHLRNAEKIVPQSKRERLACMSVHLFPV